MVGTYFLSLIAILVHGVLSQMGSNAMEAGKALNGICADGLRYDESEGCTDIDECIEQAPCKLYQDCRNLWGSYICICPRGFILNRTTGECADIDECALGYCGNSEKCVNMIGSFTCLCSAGTTKIGRFCRDINECTTSPCDDNQFCINTRGSYTCRCKQGYTSTDSGECVDANECEQGMCRGLGEECRNTEGGYECVCTEGFSKDPLTNGRYCTDVNECDLDQCPEHSECINTQGSFYCRCHRGFTKLEGECVDNQECSLGEGSKCQWRCLNTPGSFECQCPSGYNRVDYACNDINECDSNDNTKICGPRSTCVNTHGGHRCVDHFTCPGSFYRKLMTTDEFGYRQITTNICRRKRCRRIATNDTLYDDCKSQPLSISSHYVDITSGLKVPSNLIRISFPARRRRQRYHFSIVQGDTTMFSLRQPSSYRPMAYLVLNRQVNGPAEYMVKVDMSTRNRKGQIRDSRMLTITVLVAQYTF